MSAPPAAQTSRAPGAAFIFKKALISALVALVLFSLMIGVRTEAGSDGQLHLLDAVRRPRRDGRSRVRR